MPARCAMTTMAIRIRTSRMIQLNGAATGMLSQAQSASASSTTTTKMKTRIDMRKGMDEAGEGCDALEAVIRPIVEGQVRSFTHDHPEVLDAVDWYKPRSDKRATFVNSVSKRILCDLLCSETRMRLISALADFGSEEVTTSDPGGVIA